MVEYIGWRWFLACFEGLSTPPKYPPYVREGIEASHTVPGMLSCSSRSRNRPTAHDDFIDEFEAGLEAEAELEAEEAADLEGDSDEDSS